MPIKKKAMPTKPTDKGLKKKATPTKPKKKKVIRTKKLYLV